MKKTLATLMILSILPLLASAKDIKSLKAEKLVGTYEGVDGGGKQCTIKIFKYEPWLPTKHASFVFEFRHGDLIVNMVAPNRLDSTIPNDFYFQSMSDDNHIDMSLNIDGRLSTEKSPILMGVSIKTPGTSGDEVCYLLKKQK